MPPRPDTRQADLFFAYLVDLPLRDQADTMTLPVFSLGKGKRTKPITYDNGKVWIEVTAPPGRTPRCSAKQKARAFLRWRVKHESE